MHRLYSSVEFLDVVRRRRVVRAFSSDAVDPTAIERILDVGRRGPSAGYSQGVDFVLVTEPATRMALSAPRPSAPGAGRRGFVDEAPVAVVVCVSREVYEERYREADKARVRPGMGDEEWWHVPYWHVDAGAALMLLLLAAVNEGLVAGIAGVMGREGQERVRRAVNMPEAYVAVALVAIGHEAPAAKAMLGSAATRPRRAFADVVHRERW